MDRTAASVGRFMLLGKGLICDGPGCVTLDHEHGHYLDYKCLGFFRYFIGIGLPSLINASRKPVNRRIDGYYNQPWEYHADERTGIARDEHTNEASDLSGLYYNYLLSVKGRKWFRFLFRDLWKFINHDFSGFYRNF